MCGEYFFRAINKSLSDHHTVVTFLYLQLYWWAAQLDNHLIVLWLVV